MAKLIFVTICGLLGVYGGMRYARWHKSHIGNRREKPTPDTLDRMRDDSDHSE